MKVLGKAIGFDAIGDARRAEAAGYDGVRVIDHFFSGIPPEAPVAVPHALTTLAAAAAVTDRVLLTQTMLAATMRHPAEVAQAVAGLDRISGGRAELGLGTGWLPLEHESMGLALGTPSDRVERVVEAAAICRQMFEQQGQVDFKGRHYRAHSQARWPETPHIPEILIGAHGPRLLRAAATVADRIDLLEAMRAGRPCFDGPDLNDEANLRHRMELAREAAAAHGRELRFSATLNLIVRDAVADRDEARRPIAAAAGCALSTLDRELLRLVVTPEELFERVEVLASLGIDRFHIRPADVESQHWLDEHLTALQAR
jgi:alkanesulfonate monooxygenase SsuD/methylene tetrahydromethanopterin reductase-like flavin-dependent oxidoreductase (luciferase family)